MRRGLTVKCVALVICVAGLSLILRADVLEVGTWVRRPTKDGTKATMIIEAVGSGRKLTFKVAVAGAGTSTMVVTTQQDGKDATVIVDGKPSGETMAIRRVDAHHAINVIKMDGKPMTTQKSELSADGKVIKVESSPVGPGAQAGVEYWDKQ